MKIINKNIDLDVLKQVYKIHQEKLGSGYLEFDYIKEVADKGTLYVAIDQGEVLGYLRISLCTEKEFFIDQEVDLDGEDIPVLVLNTCAVKEEGKGVGTKLIKYVIDKFGKSVKKIYSPVWSHGGVANAHKLLSKFNLNPVYTFKNFWYEDSIGKEDFCPICGTPCTCDMIIYCDINK